MQPANSGGAVFSSLFQRSASAWRRAVYRVIFSRVVAFSSA